MKIDVTKLIHSLDSREIDVLLKLYYYQDGVLKGNNNFEEEILKNLSEKNLIFVNIESKDNIVGLTDYGLSICGSVMSDKIVKKSNQFKEDIKELPERAVACFINRILWKDNIGKEDGFIKPIKEFFSLDDNLWYERILLKDERIGNALEKFYLILENFGFIENINGERWCSSEVEEFLKNDYKKIMDLTWAEEDSLKYYYFFYVYAKEQRNLINFFGNGEQYRSMFYEDENKLKDYLYSSNVSSPDSLLSSLGLSESRIVGFLIEMQKKGIVWERYYPLSSSKFFNDDDKIFVIKNIARYMEYIKNQFLTPVADSLLS